MLVYRFKFQLYLRERYRIGTPTIHKIGQWLILCVFIQDYSLQYKLDDKVEIFWRDEIEGIT